MPFFGDLAKLFMSSGPVNMDLARQTAVSIASGGETDTNIDPLERIRFEELARVAAMHVADATGLDATVLSPHLVVLPVTPADWAARTLQAYRSLFEGLATSLAAATPVGDGEQPDPSTGLLGNIGSLLGPVLMGMQAGSMIGHLAGRALGQYGLPIPRAESEPLLVVPANVARFASDWSLAVDDLRMWTCLSELTHHAVLSTPHVRERVESLVLAYASGFRPDPAAIESALGGFDLTDMESLPEVLTDPETLLGTMQTPEQRETLVRIDAVVSVVEGYVDHIMDTAGRRVVGSYERLSEALKRRRVERGEGERFVERMFGIEVGQAQFDRGAAFVRGVVERAGDDGLARLWRSGRELPTPAEVDAPGLWLERIDIPD